MGFVQILFFSHCLDFYDPLDSYWIDCHENFNIHGIRIKITP